jgi:hypothetical protein
MNIWKNRIIDKMDKIEERIIKLEFSFNDDSLKRILQLEIVVNQLLSNKLNSNEKVIYIDKTILLIFLG